MTSDFAPDDEPDDARCHDRPDEGAIVTGRPSRPRTCVSAAAGAVGLAALVVLAAAAGVLTGVVSRPSASASDGPMAGRSVDAGAFLPTTTTAPPPVASTVPARSVVPVAAPTTTTSAPAAVPVRLTVAALGIDAAPVTDVGLLPSGGMEVPDPSLVGWYRYGPRPGDAGTAVLAGHVAYGGRNGLFVHIDQLQPGDQILVRAADGTERPWVVVAVEQHDKETLPAERLFTNTGPSRLALITCGGEFIADAHSYRDNIVVFAEPAGEAVKRSQ